MRVFEFDRTEMPSRTQKLDRHTVDAEYILESWLHANPEVILDEPLLIFGRQYRLSTGLPDLLALDQWGNVVVIELKKGKSGSGSASEETILSQPQNYAQSLSRYKYSDLEEIYDEYKANVRTGEWNVGDAAVVEETLADAHKVALGGANRSSMNTHQRMVILAEDITSRTETNARYLLEQGLYVQCVEAQCFDFPNEGERTSPDSVLVGSTVVDYPLSRIQPDDGSVDYSAFIRAVRDRTYDRVKDTLQVNHPDEIASDSASRVIQATSNHPEHPDSVLYIFKPRPKEEATLKFQITVRGADDETQQQIRTVLSEHVDELERFEVRNRLIGAVHGELPLESHRYDEAVIDSTLADATETLVHLIEHFHPKLVKEVETETVEEI
ncbi:hypothetical protein [Natronosalvus caseinilyticus]|uniref:hypothetical protein n=1 Tax=Natronosalvus caseinilyticus TaxID=2953747 RepID=UPI0028B1CF46|nr:hypothetical protein [Natronosalvus caseinilyticus]